MPHTTHYERLSSLDAGFLSFEDRDAHMHVGSIALLDATPFQTAQGRLDFSRIEQAIVQILPMHPRLRQKVWRPVGAPPVWIDDAGFDLTYHFRRAALPSPGTEQELKDFVSRIYSIPLDPTRPLWEAWIIEGLAGKQFAIVWKVHHAVADGIGVREILFGYLGFAPSSELRPVPPFAPRPAPSASRIHLDVARRRVEKLREIPERARELRQGMTLRGALGDVAGGLLQLGANLLSPATPTPLNGAIGPHRRTDWTACEFSTLQTIRKESGAKINDVALAVVCGAIRRFLLDRRVCVDDLPFRVMVPVNMRSANDLRPEGNHVASMMVGLPLIETNPRRRLQRITEITTRAKESRQSWVGDLLIHAVDAADLHVHPQIAQLLKQSIPANLVVTNLPGPQMPQFLLESQLAASYPAIPLGRGQGLAVALYTYNGVMHWGFTADRELIPDLGDFVAAIESEIQQLHRAHLPLRIVPPLRSRAELGLRLAPDPDTAPDRPVPASEPLADRVDQAG
jgi:diacylglycerol O-acyltransferase / wax synthase